MLQKDRPALYCIDFDIFLFYLNLRRLLYIDYQLPILGAYLHLASFGNICQQNTQAQGHREQFFDDAA